MHRVDCGTTDRWARTWSRCSMTSAFAGAGKVPGVTAWRVEAFKPVLQGPEVAAGHLHTGTAKCSEPRGQLKAGGTRWTCSRPFHTCFPSINGPHTCCIVDWRHAEFEGAVYAPHVAASQDALEGSSAMPLCNLIGATDRLLKIVGIISQCTAAIAGCRVD